MGGGRRNTLSVSKETAFLEVILFIEVYQYIKVEGFINKPCYWVRSIKLTLNPK